MSRPLTILYGFCLFVITISVDSDTNSSVSTSCPVKCDIRVEVDAIRQMILDAGNKIDLVNSSLTQALNRVEQVILTLNQTNDVKYHEMQGILNAIFHNFLVF